MNYQNLTPVQKARHETLVNKAAYDGLTDAERQEKRDLENLSRQVT